MTNWKFTDPEQRVYTGNSQDYNLDGPIYQKTNLSQRKLRVTLEIPRAVTLIIAQVPPKNIKSWLWSSHPGLDHPELVGTN